MRRWHHQLAHLHIHSDWSRTVSWNFAKFQNLSLFFNQFSSGFHCFVQKILLFLLNIKLNLFRITSLKMGTGLAASAAHPRRNQIWVPPPPPPPGSSRNFLLRYAPDCTFWNKKNEKAPYRGRGTPPSHTLPPLGRYAPAGLVASLPRKDCTQKLVLAHYATVWQ